VPASPGCLDGDRPSRDRWKVELVTVLVTSEEREQSRAAVLRVRRTLLHERSGGRTKWGTNGKGNIVLLSFFVLRTRLAQMDTASDLDSYTRSGMQRHVSAYQNNVIW
jgi:hypothetical protein